MKMERSQAQLTAAENFSRLAAEIQGQPLSRALKTLAEEGLLAAVGKDQGWGVATAALEAVASRVPALAAGAAMNLLAADLIFRWGRCEPLKRLKGVVKGEAIAAVIGPSPAESAPRLSDRPDRTLSGAADRVCLAPIANLLIVIVLCPGGVAPIVLSKDHPGVSVGEELEMVGMAGLGVAPVRFERAAVSGPELAGPVPLPDSEPGAFSARWSLAMASVLCGCSMAAFEEARAFAAQHQVGDRPVYKLQAPSFLLAEMFSSLDAARLMLDRAAGAVDVGDPEAGVLCDCARLLSDQAVEEISAKGSRVLGSGLG